MKSTKVKRVGKIARRALLVFLTFLFVTFGGIYYTLYCICRGPSQTARELFVSTILETGMLQFLASWYYTEDEINEIVNRNAMGQTVEEVNTELIVIAAKDGESAWREEEQEFDFDENGIALVELTGRGYMAKLMLVQNPAQVKLATIYPWSDLNHSKNGVTLEELVKQADAMAGVNGGDYYSEGNWGGRPKGIAVCEGELQYNEPKPGDVMVGFNEDDILVIKDVGGMTQMETERMVEEERIRDAVSFRDEVDKDSNHFTKLIINGNARQINGNGSGANPRTAIGQRADGTVLLLVTDGRGASGHLGATAADLLNIMQEYGAVNAANLDGGSSSAMFYNGAYEMTSVTLYYSTSSWKLPTGFVVKPKEVGQ
ncbi:MAG: phosphodiester glycosidase family protein [Lachnospiraceae bacterium]|nr:phosphodiester glycosidase family protein [Lachnospiraceae bacterium]